MNDGTITITRQHLIDALAGRGLIIKGSGTGEAVWEDLRILASQPITSPSDGPNCPAHEKCDCPASYTWGATGRMPANHHWHWLTADHTAGYLAHGNPDTDHLICPVCEGTKVVAVGVRGSEVLTGPCVFCSGNGSVAS